MAFKSQGKAKVSVAVIVALLFLVGIVVLVEFTGTVKATTIFSDGQVGSTMETASDFSAWTSTTKDASAVLEVSSNWAHHGLNSCHIHSWHGTGNRIAYANYTLDPTKNDVYVRVYINLTTFMDDCGVDSDTSILRMRNLGSGVYVELSIFNDFSENKLYWSLNAVPTATQIILNSAVCCEIYYHKSVADDSTGEYYLWIDGVEVGHITGVDNYYYSVDQIILGLYQNFAAEYELYYDCVVVADAYIGVETTLTEGDGVASTWDYRISQNDTSCYLINNTGVVWDSDVDPAIMINNGLQNVSDAGGGSVYVYPDTYITETAIGDDTLYTTAFSNVYFMLGDGTIIQRSSGENESDFIFYLQNYGTGTTNFTMTSNGTSYFDANNKCNGFAIRHVFNLTLCGIEVQHCYGHGVGIVRGRYVNITNFNVFSYDESYEGAGMLTLNCVENSTFTNITLDGNNQANSRAGFYADNSENSTAAGFNGSRFLTISKLWVKNNRRNGLYLAGVMLDNDPNTVTRYVTADNCTFENNWQSSYDAIKLRPATNCTFTNIVVRNFTDVVTTGTGMNGSPDGNCTGNYVQVTVYDVSVTSLILTVDGNATGVGDIQAVYNNVFNITAYNSGAVYIDGDSYYSSPIYNNTCYLTFDNFSEIYISNGNFHNNYFYCLFTDGGQTGHSDVYFAAPTDTHIQNNFFFVNSTGNPNGLLEGLTNGTRNNFVFDVWYSDDVYYTLTTSSTSGGAINPTSGGYPILYGTNQTFIATASGGYSFTNWTITFSNSTVLEITDATTYMVIDQDITAKAYFTSTSTVAKYGETSWGSISKIGEDPIGSISKIGETP